MRRFALLLVALAIASTATASPITVLNAGFESEVLPGPGQYSLGVLLWDTTGVVGTFRPSAGSFPGGAPEGLNVAAAGNGAASGILSQTLAATLQANTTYTLRVDVGARLDFPMAGYTIALIAGNVILDVSSSLVPTPGTFLTDTIVYHSGANPAQLGQSLTIQLSGTGGPSSVGQTDFDNVRLDATATVVPEPSSLLLLGPGLAGLALLRGRYRRCAA